MITMYFKLCACLFDLDRHLVFQSGFGLKARAADLYLFWEQRLLRTATRLLVNLSCDFISLSIERFYCAFPCDTGRCLIVR